MQNDEFARAHDRVDHFSGSLEEVLHVWPDVTQTAVWWDDFSGVLATERATDTRRALFGNNTIRWPRDIMERMRRMRNGVWPRRWLGPYASPVPLPADAVLVPLQHLDGLVIASADNGTVLKLVYGEWGQRQLANELAAWPIVQASGIEGHVPRPLDHGVLDDGCHWILSELAPNTRPFLRRFRRYVWRHWLRTRILPVMSRFYESSGLEILDSDDQLQAENARLRQYDAPGSLYEVAELAERMRPSGSTTKVARATIHGDLHPQHVHRDGESWWILDWGLLKRQEVFMDVLDKRYLRASAFPMHQQVFWQWLRGSLEVEALPYDIRADIDLFLKWQTSWVDINADADMLRYQILVVLLRDIHDRARESGFSEALEANGSIEALYDHSNYEVMRMARRLAFLGISEPQVSH